MGSERRSGLRAKEAFHSLFSDYDALAAERDELRRQVSHWFDIALTRLGHIQSMAYEVSVLKNELEALKLRHPSKERKEEMRKLKMFRAIKDGEKVRSAHPQESKAWLDAIRASNSSLLPWAKAKAAAAANGWRVEKCTLLVEE